MSLSCVYKYSKADSDISILQKSQAGVVKCLKYIVASLLCTLLQFIADHVSE